MSDYTLSVKIEADSESFEDAMSRVKSNTEEASKSTSVFKDNLLANLASTAVVSGLNAVKDAVGGICGAVKDLVTGSVNGFAELEQNMGGSEAVFANVADSVQNKARASFRTMGTSTSDYLAIANKMGALFQGSGLTVERSMELSTKAMQRAADMASVMGIDTQVALDSVAGAAKGNLTMMDNIGVAMNATTLEAYRLSKGIETAYSKMSNSEKAELAMSYFFEKTEKYAGNFERETTGTISGSIGLLKSAWQNLITGMADNDADMSKLTTGFTDAFDAVVDNLTPVIDRIADTAPVIIGRIGAALSEKAPELIDKGKEIATSLWSGITSMLEEQFPGLGTKVSEFANGLAEQFNAIDWATIGAGISGLATGIVTAVTFMEQHGEQVRDVIAAIIGLNIGAKVAGLVTTIQGMIAAFPGVAAAAKAALAVITGINPVVAGITVGFGLLALAITHWSEISEFAKQTWSKVTATVSEKWTQLKETVTTIVDAVKTAVSDKFTEMKENLSGIWNGIKDTAGAMWTLIKTVSLGPALLLCDLLTGNFEALKDDASKLWEKMKDSLGTIFGNAKDGLINIGGALKDGLTSKFDELKETLPQRIEDMKQAAIDKFERFKSDAVDTVLGLKDDITEGFKQLVTDASTWGADIISGLASGITDGISVVTDAVSGIAQGIRDFIGFSEPDEGPLSNFHTYMPDMIDLMTSGIERGIPALRNAASMAAGVLAGGLDIGTMTGTTIEAVGGGATFGNVSINVYGAEGQDVEALADAVSDRIIELARMEDY